MKLMHKCASMSSHIFMIQVLNISFPLPLPLLLVLA